MSEHPPLGLIEGFFGPAWPEKDRLAFAPFLQKYGFDFYLYAPKADAALRKKWREPWAPAYRDHLKSLADHFHQHKLRFGVGLSPFELHKLSGTEAKRLLIEKLRQLEDVGMDLLGLFFDDMPIHQGLAQAQLEALEIVRSNTKAKILFCPAFYSFDPILEKVFGQRPENYWQDLRAAPPEIDFAWTGPKVISDSIPKEHLDEVAKLLGRKPFLWDNLFANDGPRNCKFLKIRPARTRTWSALQKSSGWAWNPMNQPSLSQLVLLACRHSMLAHSAPEFALEQALQEICPPDLAAFISRHRQEMLDSGLDKIDPVQKELWLTELAEWKHPVADEISDWLKEIYLVGNECLTD